MAVLAASPAQAADECGPVPLGGGTVECPTADYPDGISYDAGVEDLTVVVDPGSTLEDAFSLIGDADLTADLSGDSVTTTGDFANGVSVNSTAGAIGIRVGDVATTGDGAAGVYSRGIDYALIYSGNVSTTGNGSTGVEVIGDSGYQVVVADFTNTSGEGSAGVSIGTKSGNVFAMTFGVETSGDYSAGIQISSGSGDIVSQSGQHIILGQVTTHGDHSDAIDLSTVDGNIASRSQNVTTFGDYSAGIRAVSGSGDIAIFNGFNTSGGLVSTYGLLSDGIYAATGGDIAIISDTVHTQGAASNGIEANAYGDIAIVSTNIEAQGASSDGIKANSGAGAIAISSSSIDSTGRGISAYARDEIGIVSGSISGVGDGDGIHAVTFDGDIGITSDSISRDGYAAGIWAQSVGGSIAIDSNSVDMTGFGGRGIIAFTVYGNIDINAGEVSTHSNSTLGTAIYASAQNGAVKINADQINVYGDHSYGIQAFGYAGLDVSVNDISMVSHHTDPYFSPGGGIVAVSDGDLRVTAGSINAEGFGLAAVETGYYDTGDVNVTVGEVHTVGDQNFGVFAQNQGYGDVHLVADRVSTNGYVANGIVVVGGYTDSLSFNRVDTIGDFAFGVYEDGTDVFITGDAVSTNGYGALAVGGHAFGGDLDATVNTITTHGVGAYGVAVVAVRQQDLIGGGPELFGNINLHVGSVETADDYASGIFALANAGDINVDVNSVETHGYRSRGVIVTSTSRADSVSGHMDDYNRASTMTVDVDRVETFGDVADGVALYSFWGVIDANLGSVEVHGDYSAGVFVDTPFILATLPHEVDVDLNVDRVETDGNAAVGMLVYAGLGTVNVDADTVVGNGHNSSGVVVFGRNGADLNVSVNTVDLHDPGGAYALFSPGIYAVSSGGNVTVTGGAVHTEGAYSDGVDASSNGTIDYYGGIHVGDVSLHADEISTEGAFSLGVAAASSGGSVNVDVGSVETNGDYSIGVAATTFALIPGFGSSDHTLHNGDLMVVADQVVTHGDNSDAVRALGFSGGDTNVTVGTVATSGDDSYGVNVVTSGQANYYTGQFYGGSTTVSVDKVTTSGVGSTGVRVFAFTGDVDLTIGSVDVSGAYSDAVVGLNGSNGSTVINILDHAISQQGFGVAASAYDDVTVNVADSARVSGGQVGVYANGYQDISVNVGDEAGIFGGQIGLYAGVEGNDQASALITNLGEIATSGTGTAIVGNAHDITIENPGTVIGPVNLNDRIGLFDNIGTWQAFGNSTFGFGNDTVLNTGRVIIGLGQAGEHTNVTGLDTLDNRGLISLADGHADQVLNLDRAKMIGGAGSRLAIDVGATASGLTSDLLELGIASGSTQLELSGSGGLGRTLVVDANAAASADNFVLPGGAVDLGFVRMTLDFDAPKANWWLVGAPDQEAFEGTRFAAQAQSLWRRGIDVWSQTLDEAPTPERFTLWGKYLTGHESENLSPTFTTLGVTSTPTLDTDARWDGALIGASFGRGPWAWGALVGVTSQTTRFTFDDNKLRTKGTNFGAYAAWQSDKMFARAVANYQHVRGHADLSSASVSDARMHGSVAGVRGEMGLRLPLGGAELRPMVSATWTRGHLSDLTAPEATLNFDGFTSLETTAGALLSGAMRVGTATVHPYAGLYGVKEFRGRNALDLEVGSQSLRLVGQPQNDHAKATAGFAADLGGAFRLSVGGEAEFFGGRNALKGQIGLSWHG